MNGHQDDPWGSDEDFQPECQKRRRSQRRNPPRTAKQASAQEPRKKSVARNRNKPAGSSCHHTDAEGQQVEEQHQVEEEHQEVEEHQAVDCEGCESDNEEEMIREELAKGTQGNTRLAKTPALRVLLKRGSLSLENYRKHVLRLTAVPEDETERYILGCPTNTPLEPTGTTSEKEEIGVRWTPRAYRRYEPEHDQPISVFSILNSARLWKEETANYLLYKENLRKQGRQETEKMEEDDQNEDEGEECATAPKPRKGGRARQLHEPHSPGHVMTVNELSLETLRDAWRRWEGSIVKLGACWMIKGTDNKRQSLEKAEEERWRCFCHRPKDGNDGYLQATVEGRKYLVHVMSWALHYRVLVHGLEVSHLCHNPRCINPMHLTLEPANINLSRRHCRKCLRHMHKMPPGELRCEDHFPPCIYAVFEPCLDDESSSSSDPLLSLEEG